MRHGWVTGWGRPRLVRRVCIWRGCSEHAILRACVHPLSAHVTGLPLELLQERLLDDSAVLCAHLIWWYSCGGVPWRIGMHVLRCDVYNCGMLCCGMMECPCICGVPLYAVGWLYPFGIA